MPRDSSAATAATGSLAVLVVDDEPDLAAQLADGLGMSGFRVRVALSVAAARAALAAGPEIAVVVSDLRMPGGDGLGLAADACAPGDAALAREVVLISGHATPTDVAAARRLHAAALLPKPFRLADLVAAVGDAMVRAARRRAGG